MGLKERIEKLEAFNKSMNPQYYGGYDEAKHESAQLAAESDALMAEMVKALAGLDPNQLTNDQALNVTGVLDRYNQYKETQND